MPPSRPWEQMPIGGRVFTGLLVYCMGLAVIRGQVFVIDGVQEGVIRMFRPR